MSSSQFRGGDIFCVKTETGTEGNGRQKKASFGPAVFPLKKGLIFFKKGLSFFKFRDVS